MDPQERSICLPFLENAVLRKPCSRPVVVISPRYVVVCRRVWRGEPTSDILLELVTCKAPSILRDTVGQSEHSRSVLFTLSAISWVVTNRIISFARSDCLTRVDHT
jgi:hypothetical protein